MSSGSKKFHFIAIGGVGQSALAEILLKFGFDVTGSDLKENKYTKLAQKLGAKVFIGQNEKNIENGRTIVISSAIKEDNPELKRARELNLEIMHRSDCLKFISEFFDNFIGTSGTHGKTTTSGLLSYVFEKMNINPSYAIGGIIPELNTNARADKNSKYFIAELDESDGTIVKYNPHFLLVNNLEADHLDFYKNGLIDVLKTFKIVLDNTLKKAFLNIDNTGIQEFIKEYNIDNFISFGIENEADYSTKNIIFDEEKSYFDVYKKDELLGKIELIIPGIHNIYNALGVISILDYLGFDFDSCKEHFKTFKGMGRRFQLVKEINNIKIIDDYAHHPSEIKSTLDAVKNFKRRKIAIFQPHRYTRLKALWDEFLNSFKYADSLYVLDVFSAGDKFDEQYNSKNFVQELSKMQNNVKYIDGDIIEASKKIAPNLVKGDLVLTLGAGDITKIGELIGDLLSK